MIVVDIPCPNCGRADAVEKRGLGTYRCRACDRAFDADAIRERERDS
ncbi:hypothetical protein MBEHAL_1808 [Halarchaeum acidiphilum MH1-52-1]|uniref:Transposase n=1 Tax=Halarchaeum acidiphilum MH1-52-1 TaxID=1261545 RepID=U3AE49_9EURY|nr:hypothetical protein [Halarchaeum acidiphilum]GAD53048.1 hypothetical protein MBEHAL_1808 [Halarchaeum acidiphilum MH1-52-1]